MTIAEKREAIIKYCNKCEYCRQPNGDMCPLYSVVDDECYSKSTDEEIDRNYGILFGDAVETFDIVNKAEHYNQGGIECIEAIEASMSPEEYAGFLKGQVIKYIWRYRHKRKPVEDLKKARYYLDKLIEKTEDPA